MLWLSNINKDLIRPLSILLTVSFLSSCGEFKKVDDMRESTNAMKATTEKMHDKLSETNTSIKNTEKTITGLEGTIKTGLAPVEGMAANIENLSENLSTAGKDLNATKEALDEGIDVARQGGGSSERRNALTRLLTLSNLEARFTEAGKYFMSFEFQLYSKKGQDLKSERMLELKSNAMMEFLADITEFAPKSFEVNPTVVPDENINSEQNRTSAFNILAVSMHRVNRKQQLEEKSTAPATLFNMMVEGLSLKRDINAGRVLMEKNREHYYRAVLANEARVVQILQTRHNMFLLMTYALLSDFNERSNAGNYFLDGHYGRTFLNLVTFTDELIDLDQPEYNLGRLQQVEKEALWPAVENKRWMLKLGIKPSFTMKVNLLRKVRQLRATKSGSPELVAQKKKIMDLYFELIKG